MMFITFFIQANMTENKSYPPNITELRNLARQLNNLMENPEPGVGEWKLALHKVIEKISEFKG